MILFGPFDTLVLNGKKQTFPPSFFRAFRYIRLEGDVDSLTLYETECVHAAYHYPFEETGTFSCSDPTWNAAGADRGPLGTKRRFVHAFR